jgi:hypothetical protein
VRPDSAAAGSGVLDWTPFFPSEEIGPFERSSVQEQRPHKADFSAAFRASADASHTMNITGTVGAGLSRARFLEALEPGIIGRWHSGQYSLYLVNHSSKHREWKA